MSANDNTVHPEFSSSERGRLEGIANDSLYAFGANRATIEYSFEVLRRHLSGGNVLELGPAEGVMSDLLASSGARLTIVEGSERFASSLKERLPQAEVVCRLFEEYQPRESQTFDTIVLGHVLEHVEDPIAILARARAWLSPQGRIFAAVPNARSIHRQAAVIMGILANEDALNELDRHHGHRRVYNPESFRRDFREAGLKIEIFGGYWLKPVSNSQIERDWSPEMLRAFMQLGERYPDIAGEIYVLASA